MRILLILIAFCAPLSLTAEVKQMTVDVTKVYNKRDAYLPEYTLLSNEPVLNEEVDSRREYWTHRVDLGLKYDLYRNSKYRVYWDQNIVGHSTERQFRKMYWDWEIGQSIYKRFDVFWHHRSEHGLEAAADRDYPVEDIVGIRIYFYRK